ncbi:DUF3054 domain-containing protein [Arsenicicoccus piscis]|uniref:Membrane protein n=1 Tax=Arsenicicoccus piscis TaxID=673954 RepID=A0ABQ6HVY7_9MICO|nr:DUF3054 domain-containing protein [Arsenicicoccus piscis]MCH8629296.1 DUF3054 domain-containing protein [Arsenicicoccus piscis]GMA19742.1 membrane protein [Arsenicicoccus piscis]GMA22038.1 membrane protein [Arsenicicoccus piscis]
MTRARALLLDVVLVLVFAAIGRRSHDESGALVGVLVTAWPFLVGLLVGWVATLALRRAPESVVGGVPVWLGAAWVGMAVRALSGGGTAWSFLLVATITLGVLLMVPRLVVAQVRKGRQAPSA